MLNPALASGCTVCLSVNLVVHYGNAMSTLAETSMASLCRPFLVLVALKSSVILSLLPNTENALMFTVFWKKLYHVVAISKLKYLLSFFFLNKNIYFYYDIKREGKI
ncbi:uncharacterized protein BX664DRAFT_196882 [Halteromyces radiatus]|uniref:uncharacterized protein n=1 Tax=Halteromyces radiatus TaxID=101107 RepID=UPI002220C060|nr:uncharacterized protein BX664DRAFT_196882 [Halteromyces radiatus]KAI8081600.1 hypothetical protein BX664DRAFT_196882 [Halteromyces radiatus]